MKILVYKDNLSTGRGADHAVCQLANGLISRGHDITVATCFPLTERSFSLDPKIRIAYAERHAIRDLSIGYDACVAAGPNEILDLTENGRTDPPTKTIVKLLVFPKAFFKWRHPIRACRLRAALNRAHVLQVQCAEYLPITRRIAPSPQTVVIPNWPEATAAGDALPEADEGHVVLYPAAFNRKKNQKLLIRAFASLADEFPDWKLLLYGRCDNSYGRQCLKMAGNVDAHRIRFCGFTNNLAAVYRHADILAFPSLLEGFPLVMVEAMQCGLPIVALSTLPGVGEMVRDGENGLVVEPEVRAFAGALRALMGDEVRRREFSRGARRICRELYSKEVVLSAWERLLSQVAKKGKNDEGSV